MMPGRAVVRGGVILAAGLLAGCVAQPFPSAQVPYVAVPGPTKTQAQFQQDDTTCRVASVQLPPGPGVSEPAGAVSRERASNAQPAQAPGPQARPGQPDAAPFYEPPGVTYLRCMAARSNLIEPLQPVPQRVYAYPAYPIYVGDYYGYGGYYPWLYGPGYYRFYGGGWRGGYGYRGWGGGYRGGFRGGFHR